MVEKAHGILKAQRKEPVVVEVVESDHTRSLKSRILDLSLKDSCTPDEFLVGK